jgi:hypothetical protein
VDLARVAVTKRPDLRSCGAVLAHDFNMHLRISMADIVLSLLIVEGTTSPKRSMVYELIRISAVDILLLRLVFDSTGIIAAWQGRKWLYLDSCAVNVRS